MMGARSPLSRLSGPLRWVSLLGLALGACECGDNTLTETAARLDVSPDSLDFGKVPRGDLKVLGLTLSNLGERTLRFERIRIVSDSTEFSIATALPTQLVAKETVQLVVLYQPTDVGIDRGEVELDPDTDQDTFVIPMVGEGVEAGVAVITDGAGCEGQPDSISFGALRPGNQAERTLTVRATGSAAVQVLSAVIEPGTTTEFSIDATGLPTTLEPGQELTLTARYTPVDGGEDRGAFVITTNAPGAPSIKVPVCGAGVAPALCARPVPLDLGAVAEGQSVDGTLTLESCGLEPLDLSGLAIATTAPNASDAGFTIQNLPALPRTLNPGETVDLGVRFVAALPYGSKNGWVRASSNAFGLAEAHFPLLARTAAPCGLSVAPLSLIYYNVAGGSAAQKAVLVSNSGETDCQIAGLTVTTDGGGSEFRLVNPRATPFAIASGAAEVLTVEYAPAAQVEHTGNLAVQEASGNTTTVSLRGNPPVGDECVIDVRPTVVTFPVVAVGTTEQQGVEIRNIGGEACRITSTRLVQGNPAFSAAAPGLGFLVPNVGNTTVQVTFAPTALGPQRDVLEVVVAGVAGAAGGGTFQVGLFGSTGEGRLCVTPTDLRFGAVASGSSAQRDVTISSCGSAPVNLRGIVLDSSSHPSFSIVQRPTLPSSLAPLANAAPVLRVQYAPTNAGPHFGRVEVLSNDQTTPSIPVLLSGNWDETCTRILQCSPTSIDFQDTDTERPKLIRVVCRNAGPDPVTISNATLAGGGELALSGDGPRTVPSGGVWTTDVIYDPVAPGADSGLLTIASDACLGPSPIPVSGNGVEVTLPPCQAPSTFQPVLQWEWTGSAVEPDLKNVWMTPLVANLTDDDGDGRIDENDVPEIIFVSYDYTPLSDATAARPGVLRVLSGDTGAERFSVTSPRFPDSGQLAVGDLDGDGSPEIVGFKWIQTPPGSGAGGLLGRYTTGTLVALDRTGNLLWESDPFNWPAEVTWLAAGPALADLDGDGFAEIIVGREVFDHRGRLKWRGTGAAGHVPGGPQSFAADIDNDGRPEVIAGGTVYDRDGNIRWQLPNNVEGGSAIGRFDLSDPYPQIVNVSSRVRVLSRLGVELWSTLYPGNGPSTQLPTVADFDGDGDADFAVADGNGVYVFRGTGGLLWQAPVDDSTCCPGISAFDFEGDGAYELILNDFGNIYIYRGNTGALLFTAERPNQTNLEMPVIADVDGDGKAEMVVAIQYAFGGGGLKVYSNVGDSWVNAPKIWNQQAFFVDNITEAGMIPRVLPPMRPNGVFRGTTSRCE